MKEVLFRVNAGINIGLGHISRCINIAKKLIEVCPVSFCINTDDQLFVKSYLKDVTGNIELENLILMTSENIDEDVSGLIIYAKRKNALLVIDHYGVTEEYQLRLKEANIHWIQLDSHAAQIFYADYVHHGSPGATLELYNGLNGSKGTNFLLGPKYAIVGEEYEFMHKKACVRVEISRIFISFGGGYAKGALLKYLSIVPQSFKSIVFCVVLRRNNPDLEKLELLAKLHTNIELYVDYLSIPALMLSCDIGILAPGGMAYEAATLGLPTILIALESNQYINMEGCQKIGISISLGEVNDVSPQKVCDVLTEMITKKYKVSEMSKEALSVFDGRGAERLGELIKKEYLD